MEIYIFEKKNREDKSPSKYDGTHPLKGRFIITRKADGSFLFLAIGGEDEQIISHKEIYSLQHDKGEVIAGGLFGIFPESKTVIFHDKTTAFNCSFTKDHVWPAVIKLAKDDVIQHAIIAPHDFEFSTQLSENPAIQAMANNYESWNFQKYPVLSAILDSSQSIQIFKNTVFNDVLSHIG